MAASYFKAFAARLNSAFDYAEIPKEERAQIIVEACRVSFKTAKKILIGNVCPPTRKALDRLSERLSVHPAWLRQGGFSVETARCIFNLDQLSEIERTKILYFTLLLKNESKQLAALLEREKKGEITRQEVYNILFKHHSFFTPRTPEHTAQIITFPAKNIGSRSISTI